MRAANRNIASVVSLKSRCEPQRAQRTRRETQRRIEEENPRAGGSHKSVLSSVSSSVLSVPSVVQSLPASSRRSA